MDISIDSDDEKTAEIASIFGKTVAMYLKENNCDVQKSKNDAFLIHGQDRQYFDDCAYMIRTQKKKKVPVKKDVRIPGVHYKPEVPDLDGEDNVRLFDDFKRFDLTINNENHSTNPSSTQPVSQPSTSKSAASECNCAIKNTRENSVELRNINYKNYKLYSRRRRYFHDEEIFKNLLKSLKNDYKEFIPELKPVVNKFIKGHRAFKYEIALDSISKDEALLDGQLSEKQVNHFFNMVLYNAVPKVLFGNRKNLKNIYKCLRKFLHTVTYEYFKADNMVIELDHKCITWLFKVENRERQNLILSHVINWFFEKFIWTIIGDYFCIEKNSTIKRKVFFRRWIKTAAVDSYITKQLASGIYEPICSNSTNANVPEAILNIHTKEDGVRPILSTKPTVRQKNERKILKEILRQLYLKKHDIMRAETLHKIWRDFIEFYVNPEDTPLYFVSCDISDAYGSIIQQKLAKIIDDIVEELPEKLISAWFLVLNPKTVNINDVYQEVIAPDDLPVLLPPKTLCCRDRIVKKKCKIVKRILLKNRLNDYILKQCIRIGKRKFTLKQGVGQGLSMSSILCDFYYADMAKNEFSEFSETGHLLRYVDDFLYLTKYEDSAKIFLEKISGGIHSYNCYFKERKTQSNLMPYNNTEFIYLGYRFNIVTLNVIPEYSNNPIRYDSTISQTSKDKMNLFILRIANPKCLKLCSLITDPLINSKEVIMSTLRKVSILSAQRCLGLMLNLFDIKGIDVRTMFNVIKARCVRPLIGLCMRLIAKNQNTEFENYQSEVETIMWSSYSEVFRQHPLINKLFLRLFRSQYKT